MTDYAPDPQGVTTPPACSDCLADLDSAHHHAECVAPLDQLDVGGVV